jgi:branched-chain amino acid transport system substrate-binding protein
MEKRRIRNHLLIAGCAVAAGVAVTASRAEELPPFKLGLVTSMSGLGSTYADDNILGVKAAVAEINEKNLAGRKVELTVADDASDPKTAIEVCTRLVLNDKVDAIIANQTTPSRVACNQAAMRNNVPLLTASASAGDLCFPNLFGLGQIPNQMTAPLVDVVMKQGVKNFYLLGNDYSTPKEGLADARKHIESKGGTVIGQALAAVGTADFSPEISKIVAAKPDVLLQNLVGADSVTFHKQFSQDPRSTGIKRADLLLGETVSKRLGKVVEGVYSGSAYFAEIDTPTNKAFKVAINKLAPGHGEPGVESLLDWNGAMLLAAAVKKVGLDHKALIAELEHAKIEGPNGPVAIHQHYASQISYVGQARADGTINVLGQSEGPIDPIPKCKK